MRTRTVSHWLACAWGTAALSALPAVTFAGDIDAILEIGKRTQLAAASSQERVDTLSETTEILVTEYKAVSEQIDSLRVYNKQLEDLTGAQDEEIASLEHQIENVTVVERQLTPLMQEMIDTLDRFVALDVPFLEDERRQRVDQLHELMGRADVTVAEKYRRLLEAYQIENEYGRTIEAYRGEVAVDGAAREVDFLRIGRVVLLYATLDGKRGGIWNAAENRWDDLEDRYRNSLRQGLRIARKQAAPDLLTLPVAAPESAK